MNPGNSNPLAVKTQRLFLALWPDDGVRRLLAAHAAQWTWPTGCAPYAPGDWHVTLHFIGNVEMDRVAELAPRLDVPFAPFDWALDQPQLWPHGLAVLGASAVPTPLLALLESLGQALRGLGMRVETRAYRPHVTLARRASAATPPTAAAPVPWPVRGYALVVSTGAMEPRYRVLRQYGGASSSAA